MKGQDSNGGTDELFQDGIFDAGRGAAPEMIGNWSGDEDPKQAKYRERLLPHKTIQLAVSGPVMLTKIECDIIDTPVFQRLRGIRQLGAACQVYPTALHTRFDHSIGTMGMASEMVNAIRSNEHNMPDERRISRKEETLIRLYALLHDVPHVPFGHTIEDELGILVRHDKNAERIQSFLGKDSQIGKIIIRGYDEDFLNLLLDIYKWDENPEDCNIPKELVFVHDIVSNTVCADLLDYLKRDSHFCNLGVDMEYNFIKYLYLAYDRDAGSGLKRVFVRLWKKSEGYPRRDILTDLCRLLEARYLVAERVYFHHAKITAGTMLGRAIQESADEEDEIEELTIREHTDDTLIKALTESSSKLASELGTAYKERRLYKCVQEYSNEDLEKSQSKGRDGNMRDRVMAKIGDADQRRIYENRLAAFTDAENGDFLLYAPEFKMNRKEAEMKVLWNGETMPFKSIDDPIVKSKLDSVLDSHRRLWSIRLLAKRSMTSEQISLAKQIVNLDLFPSEPNNSESSQNKLAELVIEYRLSKLAELPLKQGERRDKIRDASKELMTLHHDNDDAREAIGGIMDKHFKG